jgi:hypothetical protein
MKKILFALLATLLLAGSAHAQSSFTALDSTGVTVLTFKSFNCSSTICALSVPADTTGAAFGVTGNPFFIAPGTGAVFPISATSLPLPTGAATSALQSTGNASLATIATNTPALGQALAAASSPVVLPAAQITALTPPTSVGISGTLPAFTATPTFNCGTGCFQTTQPISAASLPLPTGAATQTTLASILSALGSPFQAGASIGNTSFGISGTLPAFAATPAVKLQDGTGNAISSTTGSLNVNVTGGGAGGGAVYGPTAVGTANANPPVVIGGTTTGAAGQVVEGLAIKPASTAALPTDLSAVTNESPNSQLSVAVGLATDTPCTLPATTAACSQVALAKATANVANGSVAAGTNIIGKFGIDQTTPGTTNGVQLNTSTATVGNIGNDPSAGKGTPTSVALSIATATTTQLVALSGSTAIYITSYDVMAGGTGNITFEYGTGTNCGTGTTVLTGAYPLTAQAGVSKGNGAAMVLKVPAGNALCALTSASVQYSGSITFQQF